MFCEAEIFDEVLPSDVAIEAGFLFIKSGIDVHRHEGFGEGINGLGD